MEAGIHNQVSRNEVICNLILHPELSKMRGISLQKWWLLQVSVRDLGGVKKLARMKKRSENRRGEIGNVIRVKEGE